MYITYIHHSSFMVELSAYVLLFDFDNCGKLPPIPNHKHLFVFVSHHHNDHYSNAIFSLRHQVSHITFILSNDKEYKKEEDMIMIQPHTSITIDHVSIQTLTSSDVGVAFIIEVENRRLYHAGDLNWWHWEKENTLQENEEAKDLFMKEMEFIKGKHFDVAFLPLDPRQDEQFYWGFHTFMCMTQTHYAFPMHFWMQYAIIQRLKQLDISANYRDRIMEIKSENQTFSIDVL